MYVATSLISVKVSSRLSYTLTAKMMRMTATKTAEVMLRKAWGRPGRWSLLRRLLTLLQLLSPGIGELDPGLLRSTAGHVSYPSLLPAPEKLPKCEEKNMNLDPKKAETSSSPIHTGVSSHVENLPVEVTKPFSIF